MGFKVEDCLGKTDWDILDKDLADRLGELKRRVLRTGVGERVEFPSITDNEDSQYFDFIVEPLRDTETEEIIGLSCSGINITEERRRREAYKANEENLRFIFNASPMPIVVLHYEKGTPLFFNQSADEVFALSSQNKSSQDEAQQEDFLLKLGIREHVNQYLNKGEALKDFNISFLNSANTEVILSASATHIFYNAEPAVLTTFHDLTAQLKTEEKLQQLNEDLEQRVNQRTRELVETNKALNDAKIAAEKASAAKSEFLANMSHEIRTPMNGVLGIADILQDSELNNTQQHYVRTIQSSGKTLLAIINDILDYSKVEAGELQLENRPFNLAELVEESITPFRIVSNPEVQLIASVEPDVPIYIKGDIVRLQQVIANLLSNAFKFTRQGEICLYVSYAQCTDTHATIDFSVTDTGVGIEPERKNSLFQHFSQADPSTTRKYGGTGLGLAICKQLVNNMGGEIDVQSELGKGSRFYFNVSLELDNKAGLDKTVTNKLKHKHLLLADTQLVYRDIIAKQAQALGMTVATVADSQTLLSRLLEEDAAKPDLILIDLDDGFAICRELNRYMETQAIPRILLTTHSSLPNQLILENNGLTAAYFKPSSKEQLARILEDVLSHSKQDREVKDTVRYDESASDNYAPLKVLLAEDNPVNRVVAVGLLSKLGVEATQVVNGAEAVNMVCEQQVPFDLILMDCEMPELDGYAATRKIRQWEEQIGRAATIIFALTAHALSEHIEKCRSAGMDGHLAKPINFEKLRNTIDKVRVELEKRKPLAEDH